MTWLNFPYAFTRSGYFWNARQGIIVGQRRWVGCLANNVAELPVRTADRFRAPSRCLRLPLTLSTVLLAPTVLRMCSLSTPQTFYTGNGGQSWAAASIPASEYPGPLAVQGGRFLASIKQSGGSTAGNLFWAVSRLWKYGELWGSS